MAPIPSSLDTETINLIDNLQRRQKDLDDFQLPRLRDCRGPLSVQQKFAAELKEDLDAFGQQIEEFVQSLDILADDVPKKGDRHSVKQLVEEFRESSARIRKDMRAALLHSKKTIDVQMKSNREDLFKGAMDNRNVEEKATDDALMKASNDVTESLRRTMGLMQKELERSVLSTQMLEQSTATLRAASTQHDVLSSITLTSKQLITALEKADWMDRLLIFSGLAFFVLVVLFIVKQRIVDRGIRVALFWTRFVPSSTRSVVKRSTEDILMKQEEGSATMSSILETVRESVSTALSSVTSVSSSASESASTLTQEIVSNISNEVTSSISIALTTAVSSASIEHVEL